MAIQEAASDRSDYLAAVRSLAFEHVSDEPAITQIWAFPDPLGATVRMIEVNPNTIPSGVMVFEFGRGGGFNYRTAIGEVTPTEWEDIRAGRLALPAGWDLNAGKRVWPE